MSNSLASLPEKAFAEMPLNLFVSNLRSMNFLQILRCLINFHMEIINTCRLTLH